AKHYSVALADLPTSATVTDRRSVEAIAGPLVTHFAARIGDYPGLRARATTKEDVELENLPNAKSDDENSDSSVILATTKAVKSATSTIWNAIAKIVVGDTVVGKAAKLATARILTLTGAVNGSVSFDGANNVTIATTASQATETVAGGAKVATQLQTDTGTDDTAFISAKKLRWGFAATFGTTGFVALPSWLG
ncbi:hypothetical protein M1B35_31895, partial [Pseudomonas sp. MAFF 302046]|nr:hypothetical protein [Pseudomonas morbosilactucae]